jgi:hypothetical protein
MGDDHPYIGVFLRKGDQIDWTGKRDARTGMDHEWNTEFLGSIKGFPARFGTRTDSGRHRMHFDSNKAKFFYASTDFRMVFGLAEVGTWMCHTKEVARIRPAQLRYSVVLYRDRFQIMAGPWLDDLDVHTVEIHFLDQLYFSELLIKREVPTKVDMDVYDHVESLHELMSGIRVSTKKPRLSSHGCKTFTVNGDSQ